MAGWGQDTIDWYSQSYSYGGLALYQGSDVKGGQSFESDGIYQVDSVVFYIRRVGTPPAADLHTYIYAHSGTFGTSSVPTGSPIGESDAVNSSGLTTSFVKYTFAFSLKPTIGMGYYCVSIEYAASGSNSSNYVDISQDAFTLSHPGNRFAYKVATGWGAASTRDVIFYVYGHDIKGNIFLWHNF